MTRTRLTLTLLAAALAGCASNLPKPERKVAEIAPGSFEVAWSAAADVQSPKAMYQGGNLLFVYGRNNQVSAFDLNGGLKFRVTVGEPGDVVGQPVVSGERIIFPTTATLELYTLAGVKTKSIPLRNPVRSPGVMIGDTLYFGADSDTGGRLAAIDLSRTYDIYRWTRLTGIINYRPALFDNVLYAATEDGRVYAINPDGTPLWGAQPEMPDGIFHADGKIITALKADDTGIYVPATDTKLYCLSPNNGKIRWTYYAGSPLTTSPAVTADAIYQYVDGAGVVMLPKKAQQRDVSPKWTFATGKQLVADDGQYAYVITTDNGIAAVNRNDGSLAFKSAQTGYKIAVQNPEPKTPAIYALTDDGRVVCVKPVLRAGTVGELAMLTP